VLAYVSEVQRLSRESCWVVGLERTIWRTCTLNVWWYLSKTSLGYHHDSYIGYYIIIRKLLEMELFNWTHLSMSVYK
jgi:hypothetical protein